MMVMTDDNDKWGFVLTLMKAGEAEYPGTFHVGFFVDDRKVVNEVNQRLSRDGYEVDEPEDNGHAYGFYVKSPGGFTVELGA